MENENTIIELTPENPTGVIRDMTAEEISAREADVTNLKAKEDEYTAEVQAQKDLKASAKAKLISGEALTEDEANTIVL
nr:hypothetical protein [uncultured Mediterranean phage uvMED]